MNITISRRLDKINPSPTLALTAKVKALKSQGEDIAGFAAGEPDFDTPDAIKEACISALKSGFTKYTPTGGIPELKSAICQWLKKKRRLEYQPEQVLVCCGAKHALYNLFQTLLEDGEEVLIPIPYWATYKDQVALAGGIPIAITTGIDKNFKLNVNDLERAVSPKTKILLLNSPSNPSGAVYGNPDLQELAEFAVKYNLLVVSDEIYSEIVYDNFKQESIASIGPEVAQRTFVVDGVYKTFAMTGFRIGYILGNPRIIKGMNMIQDQSTSNPTSFAQKAALKALTLDEDVITPMVSKFKERRDLIFGEMEKIKGIKSYKPKGAFYLFPDIRHFLNYKSPKGVFIGSSSKLAEVLLEEAKVACVPGEAFGMPGFLRVSFATTKEEILKGTRRLQAFFGSLTT